MEFIEAPPFTEHLPSYLDDEGFRQLQIFLASNSEAGPVIPGTGGFRKLRWPDQRRGKGKRGGLRVIYYHFAADDQIWLMTLYDKDELADLSSDEKRLLRVAIGREARQRARRQRHRRA